MRLSLFGVLAVGLAVSTARAVDNCDGCVVGIWDDPALTVARGAIQVGIPKDVYVGIRLKAPHDALTELSNVLPYRSRSRSRDVLED